MFSLKTLTAQILLFKSKSWVRLFLEMQAVSRMGSLLICMTVLMIQPLVCAPFLVLKRNKPDESLCRAFLFINVPPGGLIISIYPEKRLHKRKYYL